jgi:phosphoglycerol transferase MdoB-like AlkP superfamily enzyme
MKNRMFYYFLILFSLFPFALHFLTGLPDSTLPTLANSAFSFIIILITSIMYRFSKFLGAAFMFIIYALSLSIYVSAKEYYIFYQTYPIHESLILINEATNASKNFIVDDNYIYLSGIALLITVLTTFFTPSKIDKKTLFIQLTLVIFTISIYNYQFEKQSYTDEAVDNNPALLALVETPITSMLKSLPLFTKNQQNKASIEKNHIAKNILLGKNVIFPERAKISVDNILFKKNGNDVSLKKINYSVDENQKILPDKMKNIILIVLESVRSEELKNSEITPNISRFMSESVNFTRFYSTNITTVKSEHAMLCGKPEISNQAPYSSLHGAFNGLCLPKSLKKYGWDTYWFHGNTNEFFNRKIFHKSLGFNHVYGKEYFIEKGYDIKNDIGWGIPDTYVFTESLKTLEKSKNNFFAEILTLTNHQPFSWKYPQKIPASIKYSGIDKYRNYLKGINYTDHAFGVFLQKFKQSELYNNTILMVTGDHGVPFYDKEYDNNKKQEILYKVPFAIYYKDIKPTKVDNNKYSHLDITPTVLDLLNLDNKISTLGASLYGKHASITARPIYLMNMKKYSFMFGEYSCYQYDGSCNDKNEQWKIDAKKAFNYMEIMQIAGYKGNNN